MAGEAAAWQTPTTCGLDPIELWSHNAGPGPRGPLTSSGAQPHGVSSRAARVQAVRGRGRAAGRTAPSPTWGAAGERRCPGAGWGWPRVLCALGLSALPPLPPPGPLRPESAHSAAGKCYFAGKVSAGTANLQHLIEKLKQALWPVRISHSFTVWAVGDQYAGGVCVW